MKKNMVLATWTSDDWQTYSYLFANERNYRLFEDHSKDRIFDVIRFRVSGKTYAEKKASLRDVAVNYSNAYIEGLYLEDIIEISRFFEKYGRMYGLVREFTENAII